MEDYDSYVYVKNNNIVNNRFSFKKVIIIFLVALFIGFLIALFIRYFLFTPATVQNVSMMPTFKNNDIILLSRLPKTTGEEIERSDIIAFEAPSKLHYEKSVINTLYPAASYEIKDHSFLYYLLDIGKVTYIKRVVGLPGDHIKIERNIVYINNLAEEKYYFVPNYDTISRSFNDITVPDGYVFVLGDNRNESLDSRDFGCIPLSKIEGKYILKLK